MKHESNVRTATLKDLWQVFLRSLWLMAAAAVLCCAAVFAVNRLTFDPQYQSTATLYILKQENGEDYKYTSSDFSLALNVVNDCTYMLKSHAVLDQVIDDLDLDMEYGELSKNISTVNPDNTRILEVTVKTGDARLSQRVVDKICQVGAESIAKAMGFEQVNLYEYGTLNEKPCNTLGAKVYVLTAVVAAVLMYTVKLLVFLLDDKIRTPEDVENYLGISVLGEIPYIGKAQKGKRGYYRSRSSSVYAYQAAGTGGAEKDKGENHGK